MTPEQVRDTPDYVTEVNSTLVLVKFTDLGVIIGYEKDKKFFAKEFPKLN